MTFLGGRKTFWEKFSFPPSLRSKSRPHILPKTSDKIKNCLTGWDSRVEIIFSYSCKTTTPLSRNPCQMEPSIWHRRISGDRLSPKFIWYDRKRKIACCKTPFSKIFEMREGVGLSHLQCVSPRVWFGGLKTAILGIWMPKNIKHLYQIPSEFTKKTP